jgi:hypothetical protein
MEGLAIAGAEYERENEKDITDRRQYGVDGDRRANHLYDANTTSKATITNGGSSFLVKKNKTSKNKNQKQKHALSALPWPFNVTGERPRLGTRLYVRGCTRRFLKPLLAELTNWNHKSRLASAKLLRTVVVYCEESLTEQLHTMVPDLAHAFKVNDRKMLVGLCGLMAILSLSLSWVLFNIHVPFLQ